MPATGRPLTLTATLIYRLEDGKIAEEWAAIDWLTICSNSAPRSSCPRATGRAAIQGDSAQQRLCRYLLTDADDTQESSSCAGVVPRRVAKPGEGAGGARYHKRRERGTRPASTTQGDRAARSAAGAGARKP